jgi:hypothetical protein
MLISILTWIGIVFGSILLLLLIVPFRVRLNGLADDREGLNYELAMDWAFGLITVIAVHGRPVTISVSGIRIWGFSIKSLKKEAKEKQARKKGVSATGMFKWIKQHFQQVTMIIKRFARALFLKGYIVGRIGLPDPADTARLGLLFQLLRVSKDRFRLSINCVYDDETINLNARVQATLIIGYLGLVALGLLLEKETRVMIRGLARA